MWKKLYVTVYNVDKLQKSEIAAVYGRTYITDWEYSRKI